MKIGIIGAENTHTAAIGYMINAEKLVKGFTVDYVWGETYKNGHVRQLVAKLRKKLPCDIIENHTLNGYRVLI